MKFLGIHNEQILREMSAKFEKSNQKLANQNLIIAQTEVLKEQNMALKNLVNQLENENKQLKEENENLKITLHEYESRIIRLESQIQTHGAQIQTHGAQIKILEAQIQTITIRVAPITIREAMRILERWICHEASSGSKTRFKTKYYNFDKISKSGDPSVQAALTTVLANRNLGIEHTDTLGYLKDCGDLSAHNRPTMTFEEWESSFVDHDVDQSNYDDEIAFAAIKKDLLVALAHYVPPPVDGSAWVIEDPVEKPAQKPVLKIKQAVGFA
jgi:hypothetical protein